MRTRVSQHPQTALRLKWSQSDPHNHSVFKDGFGDPPANKCDLKLLNRYPVHCSRIYVNEIPRLTLRPIERYGSSECRNVFVLDVASE